jgi:putative superfamily III holin-X
MAILQALLTLISKSAGKIVNAVFGWAVRALFGQTSAKEQTFLSAVVGAAVAWPLLLIGVALPKIAALMIAFVPIPHWVPSWTVRLVWTGLALLVPVGVGIALAAKAPPHSPPESMVKRIARGVPVTIGLAIAFIIMFVSVPAMRFAALVRGKKSADIPLVTDVHAYHQVAARLVDVLRRHGFPLQTRQPGWWVAAPTKILNIFGGDSFRAYVPDELENFVSPNLELSIYPSGILLRGARQHLTWAHGLIAETVVHTDGLQTTDPGAQGLERQIRQVWKVFDEDVVAHAGSVRLLARVGDMTRDLGALDVEFDDWQVVYRQLLQLERAIHGSRQLLDDEAAENVADGAVNMENKREPVAPLAARTTNELSAADTVRAIAAETEQLVRKQIELATTELKANFKAEAKAVESLGIAAVAGLVGLNLLLFTGALALATVMPAWAAGLLVTAVVLAVAGVFGLVGWRRRVTRPLALTREELKQNARFTKERMA